MSESKSSISQAKTYQEIGQFWDTHDLADYWNQTEEVHFEVDVQSEVTYYALDRHLSHRLIQMAHKRGVSAQTLLNLWVQEKLRDSTPLTS